MNMDIEWKYTCVIYKNDKFLHKFRENTSWGLKKSGMGLVWAMQSHLQIPAMTLSLSSANMKQSNVNKQSLPALVRTKPA